MPGAVLYVGPGLCDGVWMGEFFKGSASMLGKGPFMLGISPRPGIPSLFILGMMAGQLFSFVMSMMPMEPSFLSKLCLSLRSRPERLLRSLSLSRSRVLSRPRSLSLLRERLRLRLLRSRLLDLDLDLCRLRRSLSRDLERERLRDFVLRLRLLLSLLEDEDEDDDDDFLSSFLSVVEVEFDAP